MLACFGNYYAFGYSADGETWTAVPQPFASGSGITGLAGSYDATVIVGRQVMVGPNDPTQWADPSKWSTVGVFSTASHWSAEYSDDLGLFAIGSYGFNTAVPSIMTSPDGLNWTTHALSWPAGRRVDVIRWISDLGIFIAAGADNGYGDFVPRIATSPDGYAWTDRAVPTAGYYYGGTVKDIAWSPELQRLVAAGTNGLRLASDDGGVTWTRHDEPSWLGGETVLWVPEQDQFVVAGAGLSGSADGLTWEYTGWGANGTQMIWQTDHFISSGNSEQALMKTVPPGGPWPPTQWEWIPSGTTPSYNGAAWSRGILGFAVVPDVPADPPTGTIEVVRRRFV